MHGEVAAALSLAIVLTLAGMLGQVGLGALSKQNASLRRVSGNRCAVYLHLLRVQSDRSAAQQTCKRGG